MSQTRRNLTIKYLNLNFARTTKLTPSHSFYTEAVFISCVWLISHRECIPRSSLFDTNICSIVFLIWSIIIIIISIIIIINNFFFVVIMQDLKILQIVFRPKKLVKANYKPSKMNVLKDTFRPSFELHNYWGKKNIHTHTNAHIFACTLKRTYRYTHVQAYTHAHVETIINTQTYPYTHRLTKIYFN